MTAQTRIKLRLLQSIPMWNQALWSLSFIGRQVSLDQHKTQGRIFSVFYEGADLYPAFQFNLDCAPIPIMAEILKVVPQDSHGWPLLSWLDARNCLLDGRKPRELLTLSPARQAQVVKEAERFYFLE